MPSVYSLSYNLVPDQIKEWEFVLNIT
jgi:hypothetical protein